MKSFIRNRVDSIRCSFMEDRDFTLYVLAGIFIGAASGIYSTVFNNYLNDVYNLTAGIRGVLELPREMPGALVMVVLGLLAFLGDIRIAVVSMLACVVGLAGLGFFTPSFGIMIVWLAIYSMGQHLYMPVNPAIGMALSESGNYGARLGLYSAYMLTATIVGYGAVWVGFRYFGMDYNSSFAISAVLYAFAAVIFGMMKKSAAKRAKPKFIFRKRYTLFYALSLVNGGRKQIFLTFAPWVLIQVYQLNVSTFAIFGVIIAFASIGTRTMVGWAIDHLGERFVLTVEAVILFVICFGYTFSGDFLPGNIALVFMAACYIIDSSMSVVEMARSTYVRKIALCPEDVSPTLSTGISLDHLVAMTVPALGGLVWAATGADGYRYIFMADAVFAAANFFLARKIKID
ncbi:MAG TPA: MFS transporter [Syntrophomonas sp.]|nr:MFS transporter [Syntrophomonas sp.]